MTYHENHLLVGETEKEVTALAKARAGEKPQEASLAPLLSGHARFDEGSTASRGEAGDLRLRLRVKGDDGGDTSMTELEARPSEEADGDWGFALDADLSSKRESGLEEPGEDSEADGRDF